MVQSNIGNLLSATGKSTEAEEEFRRAMAIYRRLAGENPAVTEYRSRMALVFNNIGGVLVAVGRQDEAAESYREATAICRRLVEDSPAVADFRN